MKVLISADMEGTAGVVDRAHTAIPDRAALTGMQHNAAEYEWARRLMTEEVNAAVAGALQAGATEAWVTDAHGSMRNLLPQGSPWFAFGISLHQFPMAAQTVLLGGHIRVGLEDNIYLGKGQLAPSNAALVEKAVKIVEMLGDHVATPAEARQILGIH